MLPDSGFGGGFRQIFAQVSAGGIGRRLDEAELEGGAVWGGEEARMRFRYQSSRLCCARRPAMMASLVSDSRMRVSAWRHSTRLARKVGAASIDLRLGLGDAGREGLCTAFGGAGFFEAGEPVGKFAGAGAREHELTSAALAICVGCQGVFELTEPSDGRLKSEPGIVLLQW